MCRPVCVDRIIVPPLSQVAAVEIVRNVSAPFGKIMAVHSIARRCYRRSIAELQLANWKAVTAPYGTI
jgi:hypothetical protein